MKHIKRLVTLLLIIITTTPKIINVYKEIYKNFIKNEEYIKEKSKKVNDIT